MHVAHRLGALLVSIVVGLGPAQSSLATARPPGDAGAQGIGDKYFPRDGNGGFQVVKYDVRVRYRLRSGELRGKTRIVAEATADLSRFNLDLLLPTQRVLVDRRVARFTKPDPHELRITPRRTIRAGTRFVVTVSYAGRPGSVSYLGQRNWLASPQEVVTMNQPHMAPWWFPANDHPSDKARFRLHITVPRGTQVVAGGHLVAKSRRASGLTTWRWRSTEPMAPYLAYFAAGDFAIRQGSTAGRPWLNAVSRRLTPAQRRTSFALLAKTVAVDAWLESVVGSYPFDTTGGLVTSLDPGFALENQTRPTYPFLGAGGLSTVVHEQAHQWFGNHVAIRRWRDIWLNEGFATYFEHRYAQAHGGRTTAAWLAAEYDARPPADSFWEVRIARPGRAAIFATPIYVRGAMTLAALGNRIGTDSLDDVLREWVDRQAAEGASTAEFIALAEEVSGEDLDSFFTAWLFSGTKPTASAANGL